MGSDFFQLPYRITEFAAIPNFSASLPVLPASLLAPYGCIANLGSSQPQSQEHKIDLWHE